MKSLPAFAFVALAAACAQSPLAPYAGEQARGIKALSQEEAQALLEGAGHGFAKAAELNRYPGPLHALELAEPLGLSAAQRAALAQLLARHKAEARALGAEVVRLERELDRLFAARAAEGASIDALLARIGDATARLRGSHLKAHLEATVLLTPAQVERYAELRGYAGGAEPAHKH